MRNKAAVVSAMRAAADQCITPVDCELCMRRWQGNSIHDAAEAFGLSFWSIYDAARLAVGRDYVLNDAEDKASWLLEAAALIEEGETR
jgi:hypothetical protein